MAFDFLVDPANRPLWQSSLKRVEDVEPARPVVGQTWVDVTAPGIRPRMETTVLDRARTWTETGRWRGITAELTLGFEPDGGGCRVSAQAQVRGAVLGGVVTLLAPYVVASDLKKAAAILSERAVGQ